MHVCAQQAWFAWPLAFDTLPSSARAGTLVAAAMHAVPFLRFCVRNALLCLRNVEYSEAQLADIFMLWRSQEVAVQTLMDAQLAFVERVQAALWQHHDASAASPRHTRLLLRQLFLLLRIQAVTRAELPVPASPRARKPHAE